MSLWTRIKLLVQMKGSEAVDQAESVQETLDYAYHQQQAMLQKVRMGLVEVATSKHQLEQQIEKLQSRVPQVEDQARRALAAGREDLARIALQRKQSALAELPPLQEQLASITEEERKLIQAEQQLSARVEEFRTHRIATIARYEAAATRAEVNQALGGFSDELAELSMAVGRVEEKTEHMEAKASAVDALLESGIGALSTGSSDVVERELQQITASQSIDAEIAALKAELTPAPTQLPAEATPPTDESAPRPEQKAA